MDRGVGRKRKKLENRRGRNSEDTSHALTARASVSKKRIMMRGFVVRNHPACIGLGILTELESICRVILQTHGLITCRAKMDCLRGRRLISFPKSSAVQAAKNIDEGQGMGLGYCAQNFSGCPALLRHRLQEVHMFHMFRISVWQESRTDSSLDLLSFSLTCLKWLISVHCRVT